MNGRDRTAHLLTTGPLTTSEATKRAMLRDWGSRAAEFKEMMATVRRKLLELIGDTQGELECIPLQGSGTFAFEAMLGTLVGHDDKALALLNGAYGKRAVKILDRIGRRTAVLETPESLPPRGREIAAAIERDAEISHVVAIHCETSSGLLNPLDEIAAAVRESGRKLLVDCMSSFGALPLNADETPLEFETLRRVLKSKGFVIYPGKLAEADSFRIGCIGAIGEKVMEQAVNAVQEALFEMGVDDASPRASVR